MANLVRLGQITKALIPTSKGNQRKIKDHVKSQAPNIFSNLESAFGESYDNYLNACDGDESAFYENAEGGRQGRKRQLYAPIATQNYIDRIKGTVASAEGAARVAKEAGSGMQKINKATIDAGFAELKTGNVLEEQNQQARNDTKVEISRHSYQLKYIAAKYAVDKSFTQSDQEHQIAELEHRGDIKNLTLDAQYEEKKLKYIAEHGYNADLSYLPKKRYVGNNIVNRLTNFIFRR